MAANRGRENRFGALTCYAGMTCKYLAENRNIFTVLSVLRYNPGKADNKFITS